MNQSSPQWISCISLLYGLLSAIAASPANAEVPLTRADVESLQNYVEVLPTAGGSRPARLTERFSSGEMIRTADAARIDLRFNDGSLTRVGEHTVFQFFEDTRKLSLSEGTALFLIPSGRGTSTIAVPGVNVETQGASLIVRHVPVNDDGSSLDSFSNDESTSEIPGRTVVMALMETPDGALEVSLANGSRAALEPGQMAVINQAQLYLFEFDLALFCETSSLMRDLYAGSSPLNRRRQSTELTCQEALQQLATQDNFVGEYFLNPGFLNPETVSATENNWLVPVATLEEPPSTPSADDPALDPGPPALEGQSPEDLPELTPPEEDLASPEETLAPGDTGTPSPDSLPPGLINPPTPENPVPDPQPPVQPQPPVELQPTVEPQPPVQPQSPVEPQLPVEPQPPAEPQPPVNSPTPMPSQPPPAAGNPQPPAAP